MRARLLVMLVAVIALGTGCASSAPSFSPSPEPTPPPVQASPDPGLVELEGRVSEAGSRLGQLVRALAEASAASPRDVELVAGQLGDLAAEEQAWLDGHVPSACYDAVARAYGDALERLAASAAEFEDLARASPRPDDEAFQGAGAALAAGSEGIETARAAALEARAACR